MNRLITRKCLVRLRRSVPILLLIGADCLASASDYAMGRVLDTSDESYVQRLTVPADVYQWVTRTDLGDVRIFNGAQEEVPYAIRRPESREEYSPWQSFPLFELPAGETGEAAGSGIRVEVDAAGAVIAINQGSARNQPAAAYLVDTSTLVESATQLRLQWKEAADFVARVRLEVSDDLNSWRTLVSATTVASLTSDGHDVRLDRIDLPRTEVRYLKITQLEGSDRFNLTKVELRGRESQLPARQWHEVAGTASADGFEFTIDGRFPIDRIQLTQGGTGNYLASVELFSRATEDDPWRSRGVHTFYRTTVNGITVDSDPIRPAHADPFWRALVAAGELAAPVLRIGWLPDELVFLKQGAAPYVLAYGRADTEGRPWPIKQLLSKLNGGNERLVLSAVPEARVAEPRQLGGPERLQPAADPIDWQTLVLWSVLVLGVLVVGGFAYRLLRSEA